jgi:hypothetical protein
MHFSVSTPRSQGRQADGRSGGGGGGGSRRGASGRDVRGDSKESLRVLCDRQSSEATRPALTYESSFELSVSTCATLFPSH